MTARLSAKTGMKAFNAVASASSLSHISHWDSARGSTKMATGLEVLSAAAAVAAFVEYGVKLGNQAMAIYRNDNDVPEEVQRLEETTSELQKLAVQVTAQGSSTLTGLDETERRLQEIAEACSKTTKQFLKLLEELNVKGSKTIWRSFRAASKYEKNRKQIASYQAQLEDRRQELHGLLLYSIK